MTRVFWASRWGVQRLGVPHMRCGTRLRIGRLEGVRASSLHVGPLRRQSVALGWSERRPSTCSPNDNRKEFA